MPKSVDSAYLMESVPDCSNLKLNRPFGLLVAKKLEHQIGQWRLMGVQRDF